VLVISIKESLTTIDLMNFFKAFIESSKRSNEFMLLYKKFEKEFPKAEIDKIITIFIPIYIRKVVVHKETYFEYSFLMMFNATAHLLINFQYMTQLSQAFRHIADTEIHPINYGIYSKATELTNEIEHLLNLMKYGKEVK
jgi:hypothetical protein